MRTDDPATAFAPLVEVDKDEPWAPVAAEWFLDRSAFWFAEDDGCADRKIAVGRRLVAQRNEVVNWLYPEGLGKRPYSRTPYDGRCELDHGGEVYTGELTRPWQRVGRHADLRLGEGFYLDLIDSARPGAGFARLDATRSYVDQRPVEVEGEPGLRLSYWMLFGAESAPGGRVRREGDWERVDVIVTGDDGEYVPRAMTLYRDGALVRRIPWRQVPRAPGGSHPMVAASRGSHTPTPGSAGCGSCHEWRTWLALRPARQQPWYGFGGAWGDVGPDASTTGPLGPHHQWTRHIYDPDDPVAGSTAALAPRAPLAAFAPLVVHHAKERAYPISADAFVERSTLKWRQGHCRVLDTVATGTVADRKTVGDVPRLRSARLGGRPPYLRRRLGPDCRTPTGRAFSTTERTRPFDAGPRPGGLAADDGFYLDLLSASYDGDPRLVPRGGRRLVAGVPAYVDSQAITVEERPGLEISYWLLYARGEPRPVDGAFAPAHEGDWQRIDLRVFRTRAGWWSPASARLRAGDVVVEVPWRSLRVVAAGARMATHPVLFAARGSHALYPRPVRRRRVANGPEGRVTVVDAAEDCARCVRWRTWDRLLPLRDQPWYGFGGGWGLAFRTDAGSGPLGPYPGR